jgi:hypothetical protein
MKKMIPLVAMLALLLGAFSFTAFAQADEQNAKNLYLAHARNTNRGRPGVKVTIELRRDGVTKKVPLNYTFRAGDKVKFHFETNFNAYVKIINIGSTGTPQLLFPYRGATELVARTKDYAIPQGDLWFEFDDNPGTEQLTFVISSQPLRVESQMASTAPRPNQGSVTPTRPNPSPQSGGNEQQALADLNSRSLENGKDFNLVQDTQGDENCAYGVAPVQAVRKPIGIRINLRHQ